jgi:multidrug efflux pump subunit AcrB
VNSLWSLLTEGLLGALLTGLMVLLFLRDWRSALIVIITIPLALLTSVLCLYLSGQTINIMTLGGLALAVGILVDEATVTIENIHHHLELGKSKARAILDAAIEIATPTLLILLSILSVFVPAFFMAGVPRSMFMPLSLAVGFAMIASFLLSRCFVPILSNWVLQEKLKVTNHRLHFLTQNISRRIERWGGAAKIIVPLAIIVFVVLSILGYKGAGTEIFPKTDAGQIQIRLRMPIGTRIERTEDATKKLLQLTEDVAGKHNIEISSAFVGLQPNTYAINPIFLYTSGPHESVTKINLVKNSGISVEALEEKLRSLVKENIPGATLSFEPAELVEQVMSLGSNNPIEIVIQGKNISQSRQLAGGLLASLAKISYMRDAQIAQPLDYPTIQINYDRVRAGQMGLTIDEMGRSVTEGTSSSRLTEPVYWLDNLSGNAYQVQVEYPQFVMNSPEQIEGIEVGKTGNSPIYLRDVADWKKGNSIGEYDRINQQRFITITANVHRTNLGKAVKEVNMTIKDLGKLPAGVRVYLRGQSDVLDQTSNELSIGLLLALIVIALMLAAYFQSFKIPVIVWSAIPAVFSGSVLLLWLTGNSLNMQSFMGCIMAIGVAVANVILLISKAEELRSNQEITSSIGAQAAASRLRPILMTTIAMVAGMLPMAVGLGESGRQTAPLAIAVIGGLLFSIFYSLLFVPLLYDLIIGNKKTKSVSLDPGDKNSVYYDK